MALLDKRLEYSTPSGFEYSQAQEFWLAQQTAHWLHTEVQMNSDIIDWDVRLSEAEKSVISRTLNGFVQTEVLIEDYWKVKVSRWFKKPEIQAMAATFANMETIHAAAYAYLQETLGMHDFGAFLHEPTAKAKIDRLIQAKNKTHEDIALSLAVFSAFNEGVNLFSSFAILMSFSQRNLMKGVGKIIEFSIKDESLHSLAGCWLFRQFTHEYPEVLTEQVRDGVYDAARLTVKLEDDFIDQSFALGDIPSIAAADLKAYIRYRTNSKLKELGLQPLYRNLNKESVANLRWFDIFSAGLTSQDFFAGRVTAYSKGVTDFSFVFEDGAWDELKRA